jgi:DNA-binding transcriptional MocR family regulator
VVEDDPYGELRFDDPGGAPQPCRAPCALRAAPGRAGASPVIYLSSLSKTVAPALRVGWMLADAPLLRRCTVAKRTADLCTSPTDAVGRRLLSAHSGRYPATVQHARQEYQRRMQALVQGLNAATDNGIRCSRPTGGMFVWAELDTASTRKSSSAALAQGVVYVPGKAFYPANPDLHAAHVICRARGAADRAGRGTPVPGRSAKPLR